MSLNLTVIAMASSLAAALFVGKPLECAARPAQFWQHKSPVTFVRFLSNKHTLTATQDGTVRVLELSTGKELRRFEIGPEGKTFGLRIMALSPNGLVLAVVAQGGRIQLWETASGKESRTIELNEAKPARFLGAVSAAFAPDGKVLAIRSKDQVVHVVSIPSGKRLHSFGAPSTLRPFHGNFFAGGARCDSSLLFVPDNLSLFTVHVAKEDMQQTGAVRLWGLGTVKGKELLQSKFRLNNPFLDIRTGFGVASLAYGSDDKVLLAWASSDGTARLLDVTAEKRIRRLPAVQQGVYIAFVFSSDAKLLATRTSNSTAIRLFDVATGKQLHGLGDASTTPNKQWAGDSQTLAFSPDGRILVEGQGTVIRIWNVASGKELPESRSE